MVLMARSLTVDVFVGPDQIQLVRNSIARYRAGCRQLFGVFACAQAAGASVMEIAGNLSLKPDTDAALGVLASAFRKKITKEVGARGEGMKLVVEAGKSPGYDMRNYFFSDLYPSALSFVWDSARQQVWDRWKSKDPEIAKASRGWLVLQGARNLAYFRGVGIEFPQATGRPKLHDRSVALKWDSEIGAVTFELGKLDPRRWQDWTKIRDGFWKAGTLILNERDGKLRISLAYHREFDVPEVDQSRVLQVTVIGQDFSMVGPDGLADVIGTADATGKIAQLARQRETWEGRRESTGNPKRAWGNKKAWKAVQGHLSRITLNRSRFTADCNHAWTRRIASRAAAWNCGVVNFVVPEKFIGESWPWDEFKRFLSYKLAEVGCSLKTELENTESIGAPTLPKTCSTLSG